MKTTNLTAAAMTLIVLTALLLSCCKEDERNDPAETKDSNGAKTRTLTLAAYTTPREVYGKKIIPAFKKMWKAETGQDVEFRESYLGSGAQSRAVLGGFEADVVALSLEPDVERLVDAGLIEHDWKAGPNKGMVTRSIVVFGVREGNPKGIAAWEDLAVDGLGVLTPNVKTSGGAMWNIAAAYGAATRGHTSARKDEPREVQELLARILKNVSIMDKGARESMLTFEHGVGDIIITYENEMRVAAMSGRKEDYVVPPSTILIENPAAVVDTYAKKHGVEDLAAAFVEFLLTPEAQAQYVEYGLRPVVEGVAPDSLSGFPKLKDVFTIDDLGGWEQATPTLFGKGAIYDEVMERAGELR